ncbi:MAG: DNA repair protein RecN [Phycisphaerales bacterium]|nr:DNA repair protein RecN [Phycisphaerales bacterium]
MLRELHISNLAVITEARIELTEGLNCFTGATGAGKSLVIGAIELLLGLRSAAEMLRPGVDEGRVSGVFFPINEQTMRHLERITDIDLSSQDELLITRRLFASGRGSISLNGHPITLGMLKQAAEYLIDVHGQHDHQFLLKPSNQLDVLDQFGDLDALRNRYHETYSQLTVARRQMQELSAGRTLRQQQLELYRFQAGELDAAELDAGEFEELQARSSVLRNLEKLKKEAGAVHAALYEMDGSILERLKMMGAVLAELAMLDSAVKPIGDGVRDGTVQLEEAAFDLSRYLGKLDLDPDESAEVEDRLNILHRILNKYGGSVRQALAYRREIGQKIAELEQSGDDLSSLQQKIEPLTRELTRIGDELSQKRQSTAKKLAPLVERQLAELGMEKASFTISFSRIEKSEADGSDWGPSGFDQVEFMAQTNPGQLSQPLRKIASGGELSRLMLALKGILAAGDRISVLVFDEIDANVGGRLGSIIGEKLRNLARRHQVLCITHLPQIAGYANRHLTVRKTVSRNVTQTSIRVMEGDERIEELAEMIGGKKITPTTRAQARELLDAGQIPKPAKSDKRIRVKNG